MNLNFGETRDFLKSKMTIHERISADDLVFAVVLFWKKMVVAGNLTAKAGDIFQALRQQGLNDALNDALMDRAMAIICPNDGDRVGVMLALKLSKKGVVDFLVNSAWLEVPGRIASALELNGVSMADIVSVLADDPGGLYLSRTVNELHAVGVSESEIMSLIIGIGSTRTHGQEEALKAVLPDLISTATEVLKEHRKEQVSAEDLARRAVVLAE